MNGEYSLVYESRINDDSVTVEGNVMFAVVPAAPEGLSDQQSSQCGEVVLYRDWHSN